MKIDLDNLEAAVGAENVIMIIDTILESVPEMCRGLRAAAIGRNFRKLMHTAHQLKSDCANVGAMALGEQLQLIESGAEDGTLSASVAVTAAEIVAAEVDRLLQALRRERDNRAWLQSTPDLPLIAQGA